MEEGLDQVSRGLTNWRRTGAKRPQPYLLALLGEAYKHTGQIQEGLTVLAEALAIAAGQQARSLELRAAVSLGRLWQQQGQHEHAVQLLAPRYTWFTEGFETADLTEARVLLEELGSQL